MRRSALGAVLAAVLSIASLSAYAEGRSSSTGLDLRLPKEVMAPAPIVLINQDHPNTPQSVRIYAMSVLQQIDAKLDDAHMLDDSGNRICADRDYEYLIVLDSKGQLLEIRIKPESGLDPSGLGKITHDYVFKAAQSLSPFPPFPEAKYLGHRLIGIPSKLVIKCKQGWVRRKAPQPPFNSDRP